SGRVYKQALIAPDRKSDDGFQGTAFTGVFNGNGHVIRNLTINTGGGHASYVGLFGFIDGSNAEVNNLGIENVNISSGNASWYVGGVVGYMQGYNTSSINNCYATGLVNGGGNVGVMVGRISGGNINNSFSAGIVRGDISVGGLVGHAYGGSISNCYSIAEVVGNRNIGGFIGQYYGCKTTNCYVLGSVSGGYLVGSLTGYVDSNNFHNCFWSSEINPDIWGIGNIGHPPGADNITLVEMGTESTFINVGWDFAGESSNGVEDLWYLPGCGGPALSWQSAGTVPSVTGRSASEAVSMISSFGAVVVIKNVYSETIAAGEVISQEPDVGCETAIVTINVSIGRPYGGGSGTEADPFEIWTAEQMNMIGINYDHWGKHFVLMADIDLSEYAELTYNVIGYINTIDHTAESFSGVFDGGGYVISNLTIEREDSDAVRLGLFGVISSEGTVKNLGVEHVNIVGDEFSAIGGIAGRNEGTISNCYVTGNFAGKSSVGCVAGINCGTISGCFAAGSVDGSKNIGGIVGHNSVLQHNDEEGGLIISCYAIADAVGREYVGVLVGNVYKGTVTNCYAEGSVTGVERNETGGLVGYGKYGNIFDSFWNCDGNIEISGVGGTSDHESVKQKSSEEMRMLNTFTQEGWDFVGEEDNGTEDIWLMPGAGTPALSWQSLGTVPDVEGLTQEDALSLIKSSGSVAIVETVRSKEVDAGLVISHEPAVGLEAALVRLFVSEGFPYAGGSGTAEYPYQISTSEHLNSIGEHKEDWDKHFV
ncbi:MAG: PASTA domain-containing protein, partial [Anaerohalosphaera sp.]|nr:PASTA domain-containing protein [Anaerohalosphaera sp.]